MSLVSVKIARELVPGDYIMVLKRWVKILRVSVLYEDNLRSDGCSLFVEDGSVLTCRTIDDVKFCNFEHPRHVAEYGDVDYAKICLTA